MLSYLTFIFFLVVLSCKSHLPQVTQPVILRSWMRLPRHSVPRNDGTVKIQIPITRFLKGKIGS